MCAMGIFKMKDAYAAPKTSNLSPKIITSFGFILDKLSENLLIILLLL